MAERVHCLVEIPKGSRDEHEWDEELQAIRLDRFLFDAMVCGSERRRADAGAEAPS